MILLLSFNCFAKIVKGERRKNQVHLFFIPSRILSSPERQRYSQTSEKHEVYFDVFHSECRVSSQFTAKIVKGERRKKQVYLIFLFRAASYLRRQDRVKGLPSLRSTFTACSEAGRVQTRRGSFIDIREKWNSLPLRGLPLQEGECIGNDFQQLILLLLKRRWIQSLL